MKNYRSKLTELRLFNSDLSKTVKCCDQCKERYKWQLCKVRMFNFVVFMMILWSVDLVVYWLMKGDVECAPGYMYDDDLEKCVLVESGPKCETQTLSDGSKRCPKFSYLDVI